MITEPILGIVYGDTPMRAHPAEYNSALPLQQFITATMNKFTLLLSALALSLSLSAQTFNDNIRNDWPDERYQVHGDGTVTDTVTGLMWMQCGDWRDSYNDCYSGPLMWYTWHDALDSAEQSTFANYNDWRLPNIKELASLVARDRHNPAINTSIFPEQSIYSAVYFSSSPYSTGGHGGVWSIDFWLGFATQVDRESGQAFLLVRGGK